MSCRKRRWNTTVWTERTERCHVWMNEWFDAAFESCDGTHCWGSFVVPSVYALNCLLTYFLVPILAWLWWSDQVPYGGEETAWGWRECPWQEGQGRGERSRVTRSADWDAAGQDGGISTANGRSWGAFFNLLYCTLKFLCALYFIMPFWNLEHLSTSLVQRTVTLSFFKPESNQFCYTLYC